MRMNTQEAVLSAYIASIGNARPATLLKTPPSFADSRPHSSVWTRSPATAGSLNGKSGASKTYKPGSRPCWNARAWFSTTLTTIREATPCTSICPMALTTASADGNAAMASGGETMYDRVVTINSARWPAYRKPGATLVDLRMFDPDDRSANPRLVFRPEKLRELGIQTRSSRPPQGPIRRASCCSMTCRIRPK